MTIYSLACFKLSKLLIMVLSLIRVLVFLNKMYGIVYNKLFFVNVYVLIVMSTGA